MLDEVLRESGEQGNTARPIPPNVGSSPTIGSPPSWAGFDRRFIGMSLPRLSSRGALYPAESIYRQLLTLGRFGEERISGMFSRTPHPSRR